MKTKIKSLAKIGIFLLGFSLAVLNQIYGLN